MQFNEEIESIEINLNDDEYEYYSCYVALGNIPYNLQKLVINIKKKNIFGNKSSVNISRNGDLSYRNYICIDLPNIITNRQKYTLEELIMKLKIPFGCEFIVNEIVF